MTSKEWFHSRSREPWKQWLSNFAVYDPSGKYPSVEAQFQAMKFCYSNRPEHRLTIDWKSLTAQESKRIFQETQYCIGRWKMEQRPRQNHDRVVADPL